MQEGPGHEDTGVLPSLRWGVGLVPCEFLLL